MSIRQSDPRLAKRSSINTALLKKSNSRIFAFRIIPMSGYFDENDSYNFAKSGCEDVLSSPPSCSSRVFLDNIDDALDVIVDFNLDFFKILRDIGFEGHRGLGMISYLLRDGL